MDAIDLQMRHNSHRCGLRRPCFFGGVSGEEVTLPPPPTCFKMFGLCVPTLSDLSMNSYAQDLEQVEALPLLYN